jgi:YHS domain-containing protein
MMHATSMALKAVAVIGALLFVGRPSEARESTAGAGEKDTVAQTTCPVMGGKIVKDLYADHDGKRVYFCCGGCDSRFKRAPEYYVSKLEKKGVTLEKTVVEQTTCPVMGGKIVKSLYADHDGKRVYFCSGGCDSRFKKSPGKYISKLEKKGITFEKTPVAQTTCPVMGGKIVKSLYADHDGKRVYFCCGGCDSRFKRAPEKYIRKLEEQGVTIEKVKAAPLYWTCSMHPQIKLADSGKCPLCGMDMMPAYKEKQVVAPEEAKTAPLFWTCSMHAKVKLQGPGKCPICAMNVIPVYKKAAEDAPSLPAKSGCGGCCP